MSARRWLAVICGAAAAVGAVFIFRGKLGIRAVGGISNGLSWFGLGGGRWLGLPALWSNLEVVTVD